MLNLIIKGVKTMEQMIERVLKNKSLTVFLAIVVVAMFFGWVGG